MEEPATESAVAWNLGTVLHNLVSTSNLTASQSDSTPEVVEAESRRGNRHTRISIHFSSNEPSAEPTNNLSPTTTTADIVFPRSLLRHLTRRNPAPTQIQAEEVSTAAAAERQRLADNNTLDVQAAGEWIEQNAPFLGLFALILVYRYATGLVQFLWLLASLVRVNQIMKRLVLPHKEVQLNEVASGFLYVLSNTVLILWLTSGWSLGRYAALIPPAIAHSVWDSLLLVMVLDSLVKFVGMLPKFLLVLCFHASGGSGRKHRQQARMLSMVEHFLLVYRTILPTGIWYRYMLSCSANEMLASVFTGCYLTIKASTFLQHLKLLFLSVQLVFRKGALYGTYACRDEISEAGNSCPICQEPVELGIRLDCSHIFCEECIAEWLERGPTCPMCRATVKAPGLKCFSDGSATLFPVVF